MIEGRVNARHEAVVTLPIHGPAGQTREIQAVVDTGYNGFLTLPQSLVAELELPFATVGYAFLANGEQANFDVHNVSALWDGRPRNIDADITGVTPLIGMALLDGHNLTIDVERGGRVAIRANR